MRNIRSNGGREWSEEFSGAVFIHDLDSQANKGNDAGLNTGGAQLRCNARRCPVYD
jgi:hypothetical protein